MAGIRGHSTTFFAAQGVPPGPLAGAVLWCPLVGAAGAVLLQRSFFIGLTEGTVPTDHYEYGSHIPFGYAKTKPLPGSQRASDGLGG